ncbi:MFS transporter [Nesterenkonia ebinurensis]|uniref:MFS transporter n=1 Tax=Nesterenkonia ebinurensis TaxID=2608252 RepID=UPI00168B89CA|nr:MFS transporter [Nesterenkonia ebinurensis]
MMNSSNNQAEAGAPSDTAGATSTHAHGAWATLAAVGVAALMVQTDSSTVSIANPAIAASLDASLGQIAWVTNAFLLVLAGLMIPAGALADKMGHKKAFLIGVAGFAVASLLCAIAGSVEFLIFSRALQGLFGAFIAPAGLAILRNAFPPDRVGLAFGVFGSVAAIATAGGPVLGGLLVEYASWHWAFLINVPLGIIAFLVGFFVIRETESLTTTRLDLPGAVTLTLAMSSVVWALTGAQEHGWVSDRTIGFGVAGLVLLVVFILIQRKVTAPTVPLGLFKNRTFGLGVILMITTMLVFFVVLFYLTFYLQAVRGDGPAAAAVALLPLTMVFTVSSPLAGSLVGKIGLRAVLVIGAVLTAAAFLLFMRLEVDSGWAVLSPPLILSGFGIGFLSLGALQAIVGNAPPERAGAASGIQQSSSQLGSTLGIAIFSSILATIVTSRFGPALMGRATPETEEALSQLGADPQVTNQVALGFSPGTQAALSEQLEQAGTPAGQVEQIMSALTSAAHESFLGGLHTVFLIAACIALASGVIALFIRQPKPQADDAPASTPAL